VPAQRGGRQRRQHATPETEAAEQQDRQTSWLVGYGENKVHDIKAEEQDRENNCPAHKCWAEIRIESGSQEKQPEKSHTKA
jgi:hypothetical protein